MNQQKKLVIGSKKPKIFLVISMPEAEGNRAERRREKERKKDEKKSNQRS